MQKVTTFLWSDNALWKKPLGLYVSIFKNPKIFGPMSFQIDKVEFIAFNGGPHFSFTPPFPLFVNCESQQEVDEFWDKLSDGGEKSRCVLARRQIYRFVAANHPLDPPASS